MVDNWVLIRQLLVKYASLRFLDSGECLLYGLTRVLPIVFIHSVHPWCLSIVTSRGSTRYSESMYDHIVELDPETSPILRKSVQGMANVLYLLDLEVEAWLDANAPGWSMEGSNRSWAHFPEMQIWFNYRDAFSGEQWSIGPARFGFLSADHALLFKLTHGGV